MYLWKTYIHMKNDIEAFENIEKGVYFEGRDLILAIRVFALTL